MIDSFDAMKLREELLRGIYVYGFETPLAIQQRAIAPILLRRDCIAQAQSGTGKTATFSISALQIIDPALKQTQALILAPTRELALQIHKVSWSCFFFFTLNCAFTFVAFPPFLPSSIFLFYFVERGNR